MPVHDYMRRWVLAFICSATMLSAQSGGRFEEAKRMGLTYIQGEQFDKAAGRLEEVWEEDKSDAAVGEYLAIAYLNTEDRRSLPKYQKQAFSIIETLVRSGAPVSFLVLHSHEKLAWLQGRALTQYCRGRLSVENERLVFVSDKGERAARHSFNIEWADVKSAALNESDRRGTFEVKTTRDGSYFMATRNSNRDEARMIVDLVHRRTHSK